MMAHPLLQLTGICKRFGATQALRNVELTVQPGEVHALVGENGAGKSTLMKILSGAHQADAGTIRFQGAPCTIPGPADARRIGITMIYQELNLAPHISAEENITLGLETTRWGCIRHQRDTIRKALDLLQHPDLPLTTPVKQLPIGLQQVVEIARALVADARVIIMDEPTSSLTAADTQALFSAIRSLRQQGIAIIYISHFLEEVMDVADSYTVLRDGETVGSGAIAETDIAQVIAMMVGRPLTEMFPKSPHPIGEPVLEVEGVRGTPVPAGVSFQLRRGEILGVAGLVGSGRSETLRTIFGLRRPDAGHLTVADSRNPLTTMSPRRALDLRIDLLSEDRKSEGLAIRMPIAANTTLSAIDRFAGCNGWGLLSLGQERAAVNRWIEALRIRCRGGNQLVGDLSGGNQQKVALARILEQGADIIMLDEPTRGVDVGSKVEIYRLVGDLAEQGKAIIFVSSYLPELLGICDTLAVMHRGTMSAIKPIEQWTEPDIMAIATSGALIGESA